MLSRNTILQKRYRVIRQLGQGGMGTVYEALDERVSALVALKEASVEDNEEARMAFKREAALLANLHHQALPKVTDYFVEDDGEFLVMEYISGYDLAALLQIQGSPFNVPQVLRWTDELLKVLEYLHGRKPPILHRDIKPSNLKLTEQGELFLLDFGLAKGAAGQMPTLLTSRSMRGYTPVYAPLEQILGQGTDSRSDLYSLGSTLYHLLTGKPPVAAPIRDEQLEDDRPDPLPPIHQLNPQVTSAIAEVIHQAMAVKRRQRFESATEMRRALRAAEEEAQRVAEEQLRREAEEQKRDEERRRRTEEDAQLVENERKRLEAAEKQKLEAEARQREEEERKAVEEAARLHAEEERQRAEAERKRIEAEESARLAERERRLREEFEKGLREAERKRAAEEARRAADEKERREELERQKRVAARAKRRIAKERRHADQARPSESKYAFDWLKWRRRRNNDLLSPADTQPSQLQISSSFTKPPQSESPHPDEDDDLPLPSPAITPNTTNKTKYFKDGSIILVTTAFIIMLILIYFALTGAVFEQNTNSEPQVSEPQQTPPSVGAQSSPNTTPSLPSVGTRGVPNTTTSSPTPPVDKVAQLQQSPSSPAPASGTSFSALLKQNWFVGVMLILALGLIIIILILYRSKKAQNRIKARGPHSGP